MDAALDSQAEAPGRLLLVDDEERILRSLARVLQQEGWQVETALDATAGLARVEACSPQVVVSDYRMPGMDGVEFLHRVKQRAPNVQRILLAGQADAPALEEAVNRAEVFRFLSKPWSEGQLVLTVRSALEQHALRVETAPLERVARAQTARLSALNSELQGRVAQRTQQLALATREWQLSFDTLDQPMAVVRGEDLAVVPANRAYARVAGQPVLAVGRHPTCHGFLFGREAPCPGCPVPGALATGQTAEAEVPQGARTFVVAAHPMAEEARVVCTYRDVTDDRARARRRADMEKMAAVGRLAGGVAHEINNPLGAILAFSQLMQRDAGRSAADLESLRLIEESALRCKRIVESLLSCSRRSSPAQRRDFSLNRCVEDAAVLFRAQLQGAPEVRLALSLADALPPLFGEPFQLGQVVLSLLRNALYAVRAARHGGTLTVHTGRVGEACFLRVADDGCGIAPEDLPHVFEPAFTTKPPGEGTGLGLSIAHRTVEEHGGRFDVQSRPGLGSVFTLFLPIPRPFEKEQSAS